MLHVLGVCFLLSLPVGVGALCSAEAIGSNSRTPVENTVFIFVSFSMPEASLQALYQETQASNLKAYLVLRGLQDGSIRKTAETLKRLKIAVQIDPSLFERYAITVVPTFVWLRGSEVHRVSGHLRLTDALRRLTEGS